MLLRNLSQNHKVTLRCSLISPTVLFQILPLDEHYNCVCFEITSTIQQDKIAFLSRKLPCAFQNVVIRKKQRIKPFVYSIERYDVNH